MTPFEIELARAGAAITARLEILLPPKPGDRLREAMRYATLNGGKRLRPFFVLEGARLHHIPHAQALDVAAAIEMVHCYSLVHDDLPAMDDDDLRRSQPTTHKKFDEATAILAGDGMLTMAFQILGDAGASPTLMAALANAAGPQGMVGGQMLDIAAETKGFASLEEITAMQKLKTGALFEFSCTAGPRMAGADTKPLQTYAEAIGLAFQIADDILDVESSAAELGKATQKDRQRGKATFIDFMGLESAKKEAARLVSQAKAALTFYGAAADTLRAAADFIITRQK